MNHNLFAFVLVSFQFYLEEAKGRVDYQGYIFPRRRGQIVSDLYAFLPVIREKTLEKKEFQFS